MKDGSRTAAAKDTYADTRDGEPFSDEHLTRGGGYRGTAKHPYELPNGWLLYHQNRYELVDGVWPTKNRPAKRFLVSRPGKVYDRQHNIGDRIFGAGDRRIIL
jgi:hypothetical protein